VTTASTPESGNDPHHVALALGPEVTQLLALVGEAIAGATHALLANDRDLAKTIVERDAVIDRLTDTLVAQTEHRLVHDDSLTADERRRLLVVMRVLPEIERNGDLAEHIARRAARGLGSEMSHRSRGLLERMGEVAAAIWREATDILLDNVREDRAGLEGIDDEMDDLHVSLTAELTSGSMALPIAVDLALIARFYERFGDHAVNLARRQMHFGGD
jgi:phosphate transport system protein